MRFASNDVVATFRANLFRELMFALVNIKGSFFAEHAQAFIILGAVFDGSIGGLSVFNGVIHASVGPYQSDNNLASYLIR